jgi:hypothetical protein
MRLWSVISTDASSAWVSARIAAPDRAWALALLEGETAIDTSHGARMICQWMGEIDAEPALLSLERRDEAGQS